MHIGQNVAFFKTNKEDTKLYTGIITWIDDSGIFVKGEDDFTHLADEVYPVIGITSELQPIIGRSK